MARTCAHEVCDRAGARQQITNMDDNMKHMSQTQMTNVDESPPVVLSAEWQVAHFQRRLAERPLAEFDQHGHAHDIS